MTAQLDKSEILRVCEPVIKFRRGELVDHVNKLCTIAKLVASGTGLASNVLASADIAPERIEASVPDHEVIAWLGAEIDKGKAPGNGLAPVVISCAHLTFDSSKRMIHWLASVGVLRS